MHMGDINECFFHRFAFYLMAGDGSIDDTESMC